MAEYLTFASPPIISHINTNASVRVVYGFSGTESVGKVARALGYEVVSLDLSDATICCDIMEWDYKAAFSEGYFDMIWASPPCNTFSKMHHSNVGRYGVTMETIQRDISLNGLPMLRRTEEIIDYFKPPLYFITVSYTHLTLPTILLV